MRMSISREGRSLSDVYWRAHFLDCKERLTHHGCEYYE